MTSPRSCSRTFAGDVSIVWASVKMTDRGKKKSKWRARQSRSGPEVLISVMSSDKEQRPFNVFCYSQKFLQKTANELWRSLPSEATRRESGAPRIEDLLRGRPRPAGHASDDRFGKARSVRGQMATKSSGGSSHRVRFFPLGTFLGASSAQQQPQCRHRPR